MSVGLLACSLRSMYPLGQTRTKMSQYSLKHPYAGTVGNLRNLAAVPVKPGMCHCHGPSTRGPKPNERALVPNFH